MNKKIYKVSISLTTFADIYYHKGSWVGNLGYNYREGGVKWKAWLCCFLVNKSHKNGRFLQREGIIDSLFICVLTIFRVLLSTFHIGIIDNQGSSYSIGLIDKLH